MANLSSRMIIGGLTVGLVGGTYAFLAAAGSLVVDGRNTPADIRTIGGSPYVRLADVAKAFDLQVVSRGGGRYELTKAGGANAVGGRAGKIGDVLFDGKWRFTVLSIDEPRTYSMKTNAQPYTTERARLDNTSHVVTPERGFRLVVLRCRLANGTKANRALWTYPGDAQVRTAIADTEGGSHQPMEFDFAGGPQQTSTLLPGASMTFNVIFAIPEEATPKDLVFTLKTIDNSDHGNDVRISLK